MKVIGLCGYSNAGKTTLGIGLIAALKASGARVSAVKHAHSGFDLDQPGKDSHRFREAGAFEVVVGSGQRIAKVREFEAPVESLSVHHLLMEVVDPGDRELWVVVEGFRHMAQLKLEFWEPPSGSDSDEPRRAPRPPLYPNDPFVVGLITDHPDSLPEATGLPVFRRDDVEGVCAYLLAHADRFEYRSPFADVSVSA